MAAFSLLRAPLCVLHCDVTDAFVAAYWNVIEKNSISNNALVGKFKSLTSINTLRPRQNGRHLPDDIFKCIFLNENVWISIENSLKFVHKGLINNIPALVQIMAWRLPGDKPLSEPMMASLLTHIYASLGLNGLMSGSYMFNKYILPQHPQISVCTRPCVINLVLAIWQKFTWCATPVKLSIALWIYKAVDRIYQHCGGFTVSFVAHGFFQTLSHLH